MDKDFVKEIRQHMEVDFPILKKRVDALEVKQNKVQEIQARVVQVEANVNVMSEKVDSLKEKVNDFCEDIRNEVKSFTEKIQKSNLSFILWLVGTVIFSLIFGLFFQYRAFQDVHQSVFDLERKLIIKQASPINDSLLKLKKGKTP